MDLRSADLNLLLLFQALHTERSVTGAARRLGLSQPACSHALGRLRELFDDPLFVRTREGMAPTPRAEVALASVEQALAAVEQALGWRDAFAPATARRTFRLLSADYATAVLLPPLLAALAAQAPGVDLVVQAATATHERLLEAGEVELVFGVFRTAPPDFYRQRLFDDRFVCLLDRRHAPDGALTLDAYASLRHVLVTPQGRPGGFVDEALEAIGRRRRVGVMVPHFLLASRLLPGSDLVLTLPGRLARALPPDASLAQVPPPLELPPLTVSQLWHGRTHDSAPHRWLRAAVVAAARG